MAPNNLFSGSGRQMTFLLVTHSHHTLQRKSEETKQKDKTPTQEQQDQVSTPKIILFLFPDV